MHVHLNGSDVSASIRTQAVGNMASQVSQLSSVREKLVHEQRRIADEHQAAEGGVVLDGRDMGTVVFPDADVKIYMVADVTVRAQRRQAEYAAQGHAASLEEVRREITERDRQDRERELAPLQKPDDAIELDTTTRTVEEQVDFVIRVVQGREEQGTNQ